MIRFLFGRPGSGKTYTVTLGTICSGKLWLDEQGAILQTHGKLEVTVA